MNNPANEVYPCALTIAGSDSGGGAGIQADLRTFNAYGVFGTSVITALTAQNPLEVTGIEGVTPAFVGKQIETVLRCLPVTVVKTGMLFSAEIIAEVANALTGGARILVVDPVMVSTSGARLLEESAVKALKEHILPLADWITPNLPEAELLLGRKLADRGAMIDGALELASIYGADILLKGGHAVGDKAVDFVVMDGELYELATPRVKIDGEAVAHGTGCTLSAALAAGFAIELAVDEALTAAKGFIYGSLVEAVDFGGGLKGMYPPSQSYEGKTSFKAVKR